MHAILSFSGLGIQKLDKAPKEKIGSYLKLIKESGQRLLGLVNDLLDLSKWEAGKMTLQLADLDLFPMAQSVVQQLEALVKEKNIEVRMQEPVGTTHVRGDQERMIQVLWNLLSNAIKFTPPGKCIFISMGEEQTRLGRRESDTEIQAAVCVRIRDEGIGIPEEELDSIFNKFVQSSTTNTGAGGTGLGLAICKEIIEAHGGTIFADNHGNGGTVVTVMMPIVHSVNREVEETSDVHFAHTNFGR